MVQRVFTKKRESSVIFVAPHGHYSDDTNTDIIAEELAKKLNSSYVINLGWRRAKRAVLGEGIANLNSITHCRLGPIKREFLDPLVHIKEECIRKYRSCHIFYIHGMSNEIRQHTNEDVDIVLGYGAGAPPVHTCPLRYKDALALRLTNEGFICYQGKAGGKFSARNDDNLTQLFRSFALDQRVQSMQVEIVNSRRRDDDIARQTSSLMAKAFVKFLYEDTDLSSYIPLEEY